jgi:mycofactocin precursor
MAGTSTTTPTTIDPIDETARVDVTAPDRPAHDAAATDQLVVDELLVEEISIDGMCGVY